ncbi:TonB family protein [Nostoc sp. DedQUE09]|uniref:energy transducer TonB n=1 Tax=Nostoc sp. DedQUE09 TaxID=3075394 RepID=UPI002AD50F7A|nr:TonB family protein [Nostoc sp. DedQUE09]MDZ7954617.1 TonB family protein [Nostoc sp. DedQUE09]
MSFSGITVEQRSKEVEALKSFLTYSLIGSLALHIGVLSSGISNYLTRVPTGEEEPIELAIVDAPTAESEKPIAEIPKEIKQEPEVVQKQPIETPPVEKFEQITAVPQKPQPIDTPPKAIPIKPEVAVKSAPIPRSVPEVPVKSASIPQSAPSEDSKASSAGGGGGGGGGGGSGVGLGSGSGIAVGTSSGTGPGGGTGTGTGGGIGSGTGTGTGSGIGSGTGSGIGSGTGSGIGSGTGSGIGSGTGSGIGSGVGNRPTVATAPTPPKTNSPGNSRSACRRNCDFKYPTSLRGQKPEGSPKLKLELDEQGNVTNVRLTRSSGNSTLDEAAVRQAREMKVSGGRKEATLIPNFVVDGSRRQQEVRERERKRQERERNQQTAASNSNSTEGTSRRRRRELAPPSRPAISGFSRRLEPQRAESPARNSSSEARTTRTQGTARESLRRTRTEQTTTDSSQKPQATTNRRRRRDNGSQNKLRDSLRRLRQPPQSQPAAPSQQ